jgi:hypothetical protein
VNLFFTRVIKLNLDVKKECRVTNSPKKIRSQIIKKGKKKPITKKRE